MFSPSVCVCERERGREREGEREGGREREMEREQEGKILSRALSGKNNARSCKQRQEKHQHDTVVASKIKYCGFETQFTALK